jgi:hypothetical protein
MRNCRSGKFDLATAQGETLVGSVPASYAYANSSQDSTLKAKMNRCKSKSTTQQIKSGEEDLCIISSPMRRSNILYLASHP